jgi:PadR family transcriptional regulator, regulatory protein PadR
LSREDRVVAQPLAKLRNRFELQGRSVIHKSLMPKQPRPGSDRRSAELIPGTLDMLILKAVSRGRTHGYVIADWIHDVSQETLQVEEGALYPALHRLEVKGMLDSEWKISETNRRVKTYRLTLQGRKHLTAERDQWDRLIAGVMRVMENH